MQMHTGLVPIWKEGIRLVLGMLEERIRWAPLTLEEQIRLMRVTLEERIRFAVVLVKEQNSADILVEEQNFADILVEERSSLVADHSDENHRRPPNSTRNPLKHNLFLRDSHPT